jgi:basic membrane lipoprotein Med (substrate-binding protein (PBP1-ABC) superfamily)
MTDRRQFIKGAGALALGSALPFDLAFGASNLTVGVIYVGAKGDYGYNQAQAQAAAIIKKMPGVKVVEEENVPETVADVFTRRTRSGGVQGCVHRASHLGMFLHHGAQSGRQSL